MWITVAGFLVFFMHAGFTLLESGMTQSKNAVNIAMKNMMAISVGSVIYWFIGYSLMYGDTSNGIFRWSGFFTETQPHDLFFQTMFAATCATIVSGAVAGRTKYNVFGIFAIIMTGLIYPVAGGWEWNNDGWLNSASFMPVEFIDLAGSSVVHAVGGWAALVGAYMVGPRIGKYVKGKVEAIAGHNKTLATLGVMALWFGWFGFNGGSQLAWGGENTVAATTIVLLTNLSASAGAIGALLTTWIWYGKPDIVQTLNGALAGLVSITAGAANMEASGAFFAGLIGGILVVFSIEFIEKKLRIDDAIGASSVHGVVGVWGTIVIGLWGVNGDTGIGIFNGGGFDQLISQIIGSLAYSIWAIVFAFIFFFILKKSMGLRVTKEEEIAGLDIAEHGIRAYPGKRNR
jgi:Amt family ammonium transporter